MTKKLEDFFNVDPALDPAEREWEYDGDGKKIYKPDSGFPVKTLHPTEQTTEEEATLPTNVLVIKEQLSIAERIDSALPQVKGLDMEDNDLDVYAEKALESYDRLMDLGMNVDDRNAAKIFEVASSMMGNAITAKTAKLEKKLKMVQLQLQAARLANSMSKEEEKTEGGDLSTDRNAILNLINQNMKKR